jgi:diguanylate cyclase (GGDEF)-like protein
MTQRATHDALTGLPNRSLLDDRIDGSLARARRASCCIAIVFIDLDHFKAINDERGHAAGDAVLREVALRLLRSARETDTIGRIGGDEFVVVIDGLPSEAALSPVLARLIRALDTPLAVGTGEVTLGASIGVSFYPRDGARREELMRRADTAMYHAKKGGRGRALFYSEEMDADERQRRWLELELKSALDAGKIHLHFQPRFALDTGTLAAVEALARWDHPQHGAIPPNRFIPLAEETGLILPLGRQVVAQAAATLAQWRQRRHGLTLSINVSAVQLKADDGFVDYVARVLEEERLDPSALELEVTESVFIDPALPVVERRLRQLVELGLRLAIDDFGTGYSSLGYLRRFPFAAIKIDRSFVRDMAEDESSRAIIEAMVNLGHSLGKRLIAEGVETHAQLQLLKDLGCHEGQGFMLGRPETEERIAWLVAAVADAPTLRRTS